MLIVFSGLPGTGKSELAQHLGRQLRIPVFSVDPIESAILRAGIASGFETGLAAYLVVEELVSTQLDLGLSAIVDAVNAVEQAKAMWRKVASQYGLAMKVIECFCSDEALHRERLEKRRRGLVESFREPTWADVQRRLIEYTPWSEPVLRVDAVASSESNARRVIDWLGLDDSDSAPR